MEEDIAWEEDPENPSSFARLSKKAKPRTANLLAPAFRRACRERIGYSASLIMSREHITDMEFITVHPDGGRIVVGVFYLEAKSESSGDLAEIMDSRRRAKIA